MRRTKSELIEELTRTREQLVSLAECAPDAIVMADSDGLISYWNRAAAAMFGHSRDDVLGRPLTMLMPERHRDAHRQGISRMKSSGESRLIGRREELDMVHVAERRILVVTTVAHLEGQDEVGLDRG